MKIKNIICAIAGILFLQQSFGQKLKESQFILKGTIKGVLSGTVKLIEPNINDRTSKTIDSGLITNNMFELKGTIKAAQMMSIKIEPGNWRFTAFVESGVLNVTADTSEAVHYDYTAHGSTKGANITKVTETGSKNYNDWIAYRNDPGQNQYVAISAKLQEKFKATAKDIDAQYKVRDEMDSVRRLLQKWQMAKIEHYVDQNPSSVAGVYMFYTLSNDTSYKTLDDMLTKFNGEAKASVYYQNMDISRAKLKAVQPGSIAPDFTLLKRDSSKLSLSTLRGKYTMIDFWASWCHPCRKAIPHWKEVYQTYHDKGFDILSVSDDSKWKDWKIAMDIEKMSWAQVCDEFPIKNMPARVGTLYMVHYIPFYVLLDKQGKILVSSDDEAKIDEKLKEIFGK